MRLIIALLLSFSIHVTLFAQHQTPKTNVREKTQRARIREGKNSGELTKTETVKLKSQQRQIRRTAQRVKADGIVTSDEQASLDRKQNRASRNIRRAKRNNKVK